MRLVTKHEDGNVVLRALNAAGNYWGQFKDWFETPTEGVALDEYGHPIMQSNGEIASTYASPEQTTTAAMASLLPATALEYGILPTTIATLSGSLALDLGNTVGSQVALWGGLNENAQLMFGDITGLGAGLKGFGWGLTYKPSTGTLNMGFQKGGKGKGTGKINVKTGKSRDLEGTRFIEALERAASKNTLLEESLDETLSKMSEEELAAFKERLEQSRLIKQKEKEELELRKRASRTSTSVKGELDYETKKKIKEQEDVYDGSFLHVILQQLKEKKPNLIKRFNYYQKKVEELGPEPVMYIDREKRQLKIKGLANAMEKEFIDGGLSLEDAHNLVWYYELAKKYDDFIKQRKQQ